VILLALSLWLGMASAVDAAQFTVLDARTQAPLPGVRVQLQSPDDATRVVYSADTDAAGIVRFPSVRPGAYVLTVSTIGYTFVRRGVVVASGTPLVMTIPMTEGTGAYQEEVTVAAAPPTSREVGVSSQATLGSAAIQDLRGIATDDPMRAVQTLPGVVTGDDFQAEFSVRGSAFRHVGLVIDDTPSPLLLHAVRGRDDTGSLAMVNADLLERASLLSGPHTQRHGEWIGATLEFGLRSGSRDRTHVRGTVSGTSAAIVLEGPLGRGGRGAWLFSVRKSYVDWLIRKLDPEIVSTIGFTDAQSKFTVDLGRRQQLQLVLTGGEAIYREPETSVANGLHKAVSTGGLASLVWIYTGDALTLQQRVSITTSHFTNTGMRGQALGRGVTTMAMWRGDVSRAVGTRWLLEAGAHATETDLDQTLSRYRTSGSSLRLIASRTLEGSRRVFASWGQTTLRLSNSGIVVGLRAVKAEQPDDTWIAPWVLAEHRLGRVTARVSAGESRQLPPLEAMQANPAEVEIERARGIDGSLELRLGRSGRVQVTTFHRRERNILRPLGEERLVGGSVFGDADFPIGGSRLDGTSRGVDVLLQRFASPGASGLTGWVAYTWAHTRYTDRVSAEQFDGDYDQRHTINVFLQQRLSYRSAVNAKLRLGSNVPLVGYFRGDTSSLFLGDTRNQVRLPWYVRLDLRANRTFVIKNRRLTLFAEVVNALGHRNLGQADGFFRQPGLEAVFYTEKLIPRIPSVGFLIEF
jgi:hypothetical protein